MMLPHGEGDAIQCHFGLWVLLPLRGGLCLLGELRQ